MIKDQAKYAQECVTIEPLQVQEEYVRTPSDLSYWKGQYADALEKEMAAEATRKLVEAVIYAELRSPRDGSKGLTEEGIKKGTLTDPRYQAAAEEERAATIHKVRVTGTVEAIQTKKDMLISLGAHLRQDQDFRLRNLGKD